MPYKDKEKQKAYRAEHKEEQSVAYHRYYATHKKELAARCSNYYRDYAVFSHRKKAYGLSIDDYEKLILEQNGVCAICSRLPNGRNLSVDHNHVTGKIRGLLCLPCNTMLGMANDSIDILIKAIEYLKE